MFCANFSSGVYSYRFTKFIMLPDYITLRVLEGLFATFSILGVSFEFPLSGVSYFLKCASNFMRGNKFIIVFGTVT